jgi:hypothetical protein
MTEYVTTSSIEQIKYNKSVYFILPMLGKNYKSYPNLINCYLGDNLNCPRYNFRAIFLNNKELDDRLINQYFEKQYILDDNTYMYHYNIPREYNDDYNYYCQGKFSKFTDKYKQVLAGRNIDSIMYKILYRTKDRIKYIEDMVGEKLPNDAEVASLPDLSIEIYDK